MKKHEMQQELVQLGNGAHALATQILGNPDDACRQELAELWALQQRISKAHLSEVGEDYWRETMQNMTVQISRSIGWLLFSTDILAGVSVLTPGVIPENLA